MPSQAEQDKYRQDRLKEWFKDNKGEWADLVAEMEICKDNAIESGFSMMCENRDWFAGKRAGIKEIMKFEDKYKEKNG